MENGPNFGNFQKRLRIYTKNEQIELPEITTTTFGAERTTEDLVPLGIIGRNKEIRNLGLGRNN